MIDLFTDDGTNKYDAKEFGLDGVCGVRIYHVNATGNHNMFNIELVQARGANTFTDMNYEFNKVTAK